MSNKNPIDFVNNLLSHQERDVRDLAIIASSYINYPRDKYHTMEELYEHRHALFIALIKIIDSNITPLGATNLRCWKSKCHNDGSSYEGWFIAGIYKPRVDGTEWQISYHLPIRLWDSVNCIELDRGREWDGHTSADVIERLKSI